MYSWVQENNLPEEEENETDGEKGPLLNLLHMVAMPAIQEKLYKDAKCIIPRSLAKTLTHCHPHLQDLHQLL